MESLGRFSEKSGYHAALASASVPSSDADLPEGQKALRCQDPTDLRVRNQEQPRGLPASVTRVGQKRLSEGGSVSWGLICVLHFCESFGTFVGI
jgi:hypothetical protein